MKMQQDSAVPEQFVVSFFSLHSIISDLSRNVYSYSLLHMIKIQMILKRYFSRVASLYYILSTYTLNKWVIDGEIRIYIGSD